MPNVTLSLRWLVVDCVDPQGIARFWSAALQRPIADGGSDWASIPGSPHLFFVQVPEPKSTKSRLHLDWDSPDREAEVLRLIELGATRHADREEAALGLAWTVVSDPEGNEFCVVQADA